MSEMPNSSTEGKKSIKSMDVESLIKLLNIAYDLRKAFENGKEIEPDELKIDVSLMVMLFEYLATNLDKENVDVKLLKFLEKFLGIKKNKKKKKQLEHAEQQNEEDLEYEEEQEVELSKEEKERRYRLAMYEIYKVINPHQLAGETAFENFLNNVITRGVRVAMEYEGAEYAKVFDKELIENLESHRFSFVQNLKDHGAIGGGRGF